MSFSHDTWIFLGANSYEIDPTNVKGANDSYVFLNILLILLKDAFSVLDPV